MFWSCGAEFPGFFSGKARVCPHFRQNFFSPSKFNTGLLRKAICASRLTFLQFALHFCRSRNHCKCLLRPNFTTYIIQSILFYLIRASLVAQRVKHLPAMWETWVRSLVRKIPWGGKRQPTPVFLPGESHGWRSLVGYRPRGRKESETTERLHFLLFN